MTTLRALQAASVLRARRWHEDRPWTGADWSNAVLGEVGEVAEVFALLVAGAGKAGNTVKKLRRLETGTAGLLDTKTPAELVAELADEIADVLCYAPLLAAHYGIDLEAAVVSKFNRVSDRQGFPEKLAETPL